MKREEEEEQEKEIGEISNYDEAAVRGEHNLQLIYYLSLVKLISSDPL